MRRKFFSLFIALLLLGSSQTSSVLAWGFQPNEAQQREVPEEMSAEFHPERDENGEKPEYIPPSEESLRRTEEQVQAFDCATVTDVPQKECEALVALYQSTNGAGWTDNTNWLQSTTVGDWKGIVLYAGGVYKIKLDENNLRGKIPQEIGQFSSLRELRLNKNKLNNQIPSTIGRLNKLNGLVLYENQLSGRIPVELGQLSQLLDLHISNNAFHGSIPETLGNLRNLLSLNLAYNYLSGRIPAALGHMSALENLNLSDNQLAGSLPAELGRLSKLRVLDVARNHLSGVLPDEIGNLTNLKALRLERNAFEGIVPASITNLVNLCGGTDNLEGCSGYYTKFDYNQFDVPQPEPQHSFLTLKNPLWADSQRTPFDCGEIRGAPVSECEALVDFYYFTNGLNWDTNTGWLRDYDLGAWHGVHVYEGQVKLIMMTENNVRGQLPDSLADLTGLRLLDLRENEISGEIPKAIGDLPDLVTFNLVNNNFYGSIPAEIGKLSKLKILVLADNELGGSIPPELGNLSSLEELSLSYNQLEGAIPNDLENLTGLRKLWMDHNRLSGNLPEIFGQMPKLKTLILDGNQLFGSVPDSIGSATELRELWLDNNYFFGDMPASITQLTKLCGGTDAPADCDSWERTYFGNNCFNVPQPEPQHSFMTLKDPSWASSQTHCKQWTIQFPMIRRP